jgi:hypothetical protein
MKTWRVPDDKHGMTPDLMLRNNYFMFIMVELSLNMISLWRGTFPYTGWSGRFRPLHEAPAGEARIDA